jgi:hypothetical protein
LFKLSRFKASVKKASQDSHAPVVASSDPAYARAVKLYYELCPGAAREMELGEEEFDALVRFWSW